MVVQISGSYSCWTADLGHTETSFCILFPAEMTDRCHWLVRSQPHTILNDTLIAGNSWTNNLRNSFTSIIYMIILWSLIKTSPYLDIFSRLSMSAFPLTSLVYFLSATYALSTLLYEPVSQCFPPMQLVMTAVFFPFLLCFSCFSIFLILKVCFFPSM